MTKTQTPPTGSGFDRRAYEGLMATLRSGNVNPTRRDMLRWSAIASGAIATAGMGVRTASSAGGGAGAPAFRRYQDDEIETDAEIIVPFDPFGQDVTLDPHRTTNSGAFWVMFPNVWGGLLRYTETGAVETDLAETFTVSDDGTVYTFQIRSDATYANGNEVLADHFVSSWRRALDPSITSPMASFMQHVEGYADFVAGESEDIGFEAVDDATVEITLSQPVNYFPSYLASFVWSVVDPAVIESEGESNFVLADAGTGPWRFTEYDATTQFVMEPNTNHYRGNSPSIARITWPIVSGPTAASSALTLYTDEDAVSADVPLSLLEQVQGDETLSEELVQVAPSGTVRSIAMDFNQAPFDDVRVRRAIAQGIDRDQWANEIYRGTYAPTTSFTPPVVSETSTYEAPEGLEFDLDAAQQSLEDADFAGGEGLPEIVYFQSADDTSEEIEAAAALLAMINDNLGISITHDTSRTADQIFDLQIDNGGRQFDIITWQTVTETPQLLSFACHPGSSYMSGWFNWNEDLEETGDFDAGAAAEEFASLTDEADVEQDEAQRDDLYSQAEELLLQHAVYVPLGTWTQMYVQKPWLQGTRQGAWTGRLPVVFDQDVVVLQR